MNTKITVAALKGGVGKTSYSISHALHREYGVVTNDSFSIIEDRLPELHGRILEPGEEVPEFLPEAKIIYDFGGYADNRLIQAIKYSDAVVIPSGYTPIDLKGTVNTIAEIIDLGKPITVIANFDNNKTNSFEIVSNTIKQAGFDQITVFPLKQSKFIEYVVNGKDTDFLTLDQLLNSSGLARHMYVDVYEQLTSIFNHVENI